MRYRFQQFLKHSAHPPVPVPQTNAIITKTKALVKYSKAARGKGRDGLLMSERLLIGAYTNPQDAAGNQSLNVTHD
jgi:hypothetical protein